MLMKQFGFFAVTVLIIGGCNTNPPMSPNVTATGNISLKIHIDNSTSYLPVNKVVVLENFVNVGCYPCQTTNRIIRQLSNKTYGRKKLVLIKFPTNFPAPNDIFYLAAKEFCDSRMDYYNIFFAPSIIIDGILRPIASDSASIIEAIDSRLTVPPRFDVGVNTTLEGNFIIDIAIKFIDSSAINMSDLVIHTAITETDIEFQQPPGSNDETKFYDVIRLMLPTKNGISLRQLIENGNLSFEFEDAMFSDWNLEKLNAVVFIQNTITKEVYQTGSTF